MALHWLELYRAVAAPRWDLVVDLRGSALAVSAVDARAARGGQGRLRASTRVAQLARLFALDPPPAPRLWLAPRTRARAASLVPPGGPVLAIGPAANWRGKEWRGRALRRAGAAPDRARRAAAQCARRRARGGA